MANVTRKTRGTEDLRRQRLEVSLEDLLATYPYLISPGLNRPKRQEWISDKDRVDLLFLTGGHSLVVEIKFGVCDVRSVRQILRYIEILRVTHPALRGFLIGHRLSVNAAKLLKDHADQVAFLGFDLDVPTSVFVCTDCRKAYDARKHACPHCGCTSIIAT